jgi:chaperonin GroEL
MPAKQIAHQQAAHEKIRAGVSKLAKVVGATLGPRGRVVCLEKSFGAPVATKDGITVAKEVDLKDPYENIGAKLVREAAQKTADEAGDGTTTATILAQAIFEEGLKNLAAGAHAPSLKRGIEKAVVAVVADLKKSSVPVKGHADIANVGRIAANNDPEIGQMVADAMDKVGKEGVITIEESKSMTTALDFTEGMELDKGYISPYFVTDPGRREGILEDAFILIYEKKISALKEIVPLLEKVAQSGKPLLIIAEEVEGEALATLVVNHLRGTLKCIAIKAPAFGDRRKAIMEDIAILTGGQAVLEGLGVELSKLDLTYLGKAKRVVVEKEKTLVTADASTKKAVEGRIAQIREEIRTTTSDYDREKLEERLAKLGGGVAVIRVGAPTEVAMKERKDRVDDAIHACKAAASEGVLPGGGVALLRASKAIDGLKLEEEEMTGARIVQRALRIPLMRIAENAGFEPTVVADKVGSLTGNMGFNAETGEYEDMMKSGIIDPTKVVRSELQNAASIATLLLTSDHVITEIPEKEEKKK